MPDMGIGKVVSVESPDNRRGSCKVDGLCFQSRNFPYGDSDYDSCVVSLPPNSFVRVVAFATEGCCDYLTIDGS